MYKLLLYSMFGSLLLLTGCQSSTTPHPMADTYPDLPDNETCFQKIAECYAYFKNPANAREGELFDLSGRPLKVIVEPYPLSAYLGILIGRGAVTAYTLPLTKQQFQQMMRQNPMKNHPWLINITGTPSLVGLEEYFNHQDPSFVRCTVFYYKTSHQKEFEAWLRQNLSPQELIRTPEKQK